MKKWTAVLLASVLLPLSVPAQGSMNIIKQRAKDLRDQNNARQGVPAQPGRPAPTPQTTPAPAPVTVTLTAQQAAIARLQQELSNFRPGTQVTPEMKQSLVRALQSTAPGTLRATPALSKLAEELSDVLSRKLLSNVTRTKLAQSLALTLSAPAGQKYQSQDGLKNIQALLQGAGVDQKDVARITEAASAVSPAVEKTAAK